MGAAPVIEGMEGELNWQNHLAHADLAALGPAPDPPDHARDDEDADANDHD